MLGRWRARLARMSDAAAGCRCTTRRDGACCGSGRVIVMAFDVAGMAAWPRGRHSLVRARALWPTVMLCALDATLALSAVAAPSRPRRPARRAAAVCSKSGSSRLGRLHGQLLLVRKRHDEGALPRCIAQLHGASSSSCTRCPSARRLVERSRHGRELPRPCQHARTHMSL
jgi:hypothetical protein